MDTIKTVGIISKPNTEPARVVVPELLDWLAARGITARYDEQTAQYAGRDGGVPRDDVPDGTQLVIVLGGDGTLLSAARAIAGRNIPVFPVNLGGLGFLTAITIDDLYPELERALRNEHRIGRRNLLRCDLIRGDRIVAEYEALNDAVMAKSDLARMIDLEAYVDSNFMCDYKADGLIVATPTGSTAYSLSAGGPIIFPSVNALCITPICPHMLTNRPVIVPGTSTIEVVCLAKNDEAFLTIDGQVGEQLMYGDKVVCSASPKALSLIRPPQMMYFDVLRAKLHWGHR